MINEHYVWLRVAGGMGSHSELKNRVAQGAVVAAVEVSVIVATRDRSTQLANLLRDLLLQSIDEAFEVLVVDNSSTSETRQLLEQHASRLCLRTLRESVVGKSVALNRGLLAASGGLFVFTDDDVRVPPQWLKELHRAAQTNQASDVFCGPVVPRLARRVEPAWFQNSSFAAPMVARFTPAGPEGPLAKPAIPLGPNFAVRRLTALKCSFRPDLGPGEEGPFLCEDTAFILDCLRGGASYFVPGAGVLHIVRPTLLDLECMKDRAFWLGRSRVRMDGHKNMPNNVPGLWRHWFDDSRNYFDTVMSLNEWFGRSAEFAHKGLHSEAVEVYSMVTRFAPRGFSTALGKCATKASAELRSLLRSNL